MKIVVPFPPVTTMDAVVRLIVDRLSKAWAQSGGQGGLKWLHILAVANSFAVKPSLRSNMPYDTKRTSRQSP